MEDKDESYMISESLFKELEILRIKDKQFNEKIAWYEDCMKLSDKKLVEYREVLTSRYNAINELKGVIKVMAKEF